MKRLQFLFFTMIYLTANLSMHGSTTEDAIREQRKDELIACYETSIAYGIAIQTELQRMAGRSVMETTKEAVNFGIEYPTTDIKEGYNNGKFYQGSIRFKQLLDAIALQNKQCEYIKEQIPTREEDQN